MADELVNIASFEFDTSRMEQSLEELNGKIYDLRQEQERYRNQQKANALEVRNLEAEQRRLTATNQQAGQAYNDNKKKLEELNARQRQNFDTQRGLVTQAGVLQTQYNGLNRQYQTFLTTEGQLLTVTDLYNNALNAQVTSVNSARKANSDILKLRNQLNPAIREEAAMIRQLNEQYDANTEYIRDNVSQFENMKMSIGDYKNQISEALGEMNLFNGGFSGFISRSNEAGGVMNLLKSSFTGVIAGIRGMTMASLQFLATPIGAVIGAIGLALAPVISYLTSTQEGIDKVTSVTRPLVAIFDSLVGIVQKIGKYISDAFSNPMESLKNFGSFIKDNIVNRFNGLLELIPAMGKAISLLFEGEFSEAGKVAADAAGKVALGVENITDKTINAAKATKEFFETAIANGKEYDRIMKQLDSTEASFIEKQGALKEELKQQNLIAEDTTKSLAKREAAAVRTVEIARELRKLETDRLDLEIKAMKLLQSRNDVSDAQRAELAKLVKARNEANASSLELETTQNNKVNTIRKEASANAIKAAKEANAAKIKDMEIELSMFKLNESQKLKSVENTESMLKGVRDRELAIIEKQYKSGLIKKKEYDLKRKESEVKYIEETGVLMADAANYELQVFKDSNAQRLKDNKFFSDELFYQEIDRINRIQDAEKKALKVSFDNNLISKQEYEDEINRINAEAQAERDATLIEREEAQKTKDAFDYQLKSELEAEQRKYNLDLALADFEKGYQDRRLAAEKAGADMTLFEKAEAKKRKDLEYEVNANKLQLASTTLSNIASIFGEQSKAAKAAAIMQTTIDTYASATAAYKGMAQTIPGPVGIGLGIAAAASSVAMGLANVKKIVGTKEATPPKEKRFARGVIGLDGDGTETSDSIPANLSRGESVINARGTALFPNTLNAINMLGGGDISSNSMIQGGILSEAMGGNIASIIAEAVAIGAEAGTSRGSKDGLTELSENRLIQNNAKF